MWAHKSDSVAMGAAMQAELLTKTIDCLVDSNVTDIVTLPLGIGKIGGRVSNVIAKNLKIPCQHTKNYFTTVDNQSSLHLVVYEGESLMQKDNTKLGEFRLLGITPAKAGVTSADVTFSINSDGILNVTAVEKGKNNTVQIKIDKKSNGLSRSAMARMVLIGDD
jgi:molecular chaperone DnaK (HSP70)